MKSTWYLSAGCIDNANINIFLQKVVNNLIKKIVLIFKGKDGNYPSFGRDVFMSLTVIISVIG
jgi:hypothetical protein